MLKDRKIEHDDTPASINLKIYDIIGKLMNFFDFNIFGL